MPRYVIRKLAHVVFIPRLTCRIVCSNMILMLTYFLQDDLKIMEALGGYLANSPAMAPMDNQDIAWEEFITGGSEPDVQGNAQAEIQAEIQDNIMADGDDLFGDLEMENSVDGAQTPFTSTDSGNSMPITLPGTPPSSTCKASQPAPIDKMPLALPGMAAQPAVIDKMPLALPRGASAPTNSAPISESNNHGDTAAAQAPKADFIPNKPASGVGALAGTSSTIPPHELQKPAPIPAPIPTNVQNMQTAVQKAPQLTNAVGTNAQQGTAGVYNPDIPLPSVEKRNEVPSKTSKPKKKAATKRAQKKAASPLISPPSANAGVSAAA